MRKRVIKKKPALKKKKITRKVRPVVKTKKPKKVVAVLETNPFGVFIPRKAKYLILGSFGGKMGEDNNYDWFYGTKRNQFWPIMEGAYKTKFKNTKAKQKHFEKLGIAITDIIYQCIRKSGSNLDNNLTNIVYNTEPINLIFKEYPIRKIFFTSRFVEVKFRKEFKHLIDKYITLELITLPSPSPRYAKIKLSEKVKAYKKLLPNL